MAPFGRSPEGTRTARRMVGLGRLERPTSPLSGVRSNHLSYRPKNVFPRTPKGAAAERSTPITLIVRRRKRNEDGGVPHRGPDLAPMFLQSSDTIGRDGFS